MKKSNALANFLFEISYSDDVYNVGWNLLRIEKNQSLSQHLFRTAIIAFILAQIEKTKNPQKVALAGLLHRMQQTRLGDRHKVTAQYVDKSPYIKDKVRQDQLSLLPASSRAAFQDVLRLTEEEKVIVKDADQISFALQAKSYVDRGYDRAQIWIERIKQVLITDSAKDLLDNIEQTHYCDWWKNIKKKPQKDKKEYISQI